MRQIVSRSRYAASWIGDRSILSVAQAFLDEGAQVVSICCSESGRDQRWTVFAVVESDEQLARVDEKIKAPVKLEGADL